MTKWLFPLDPDCPIVAKHKTGELDNTIHRGQCVRCYEYGIANADVCSQCETNPALRERRRKSNLVCGVCVATHKYKKD